MRWRGVCLSLHKVMKSTHTWMTESRGCSTRHAIHLVCLLPSVLCYLLLPLAASAATPAPKRVLANLMVVLGDSSLGGYWHAELEKEFAPFTNRVACNWLDQCALPEMLEQVKHPPPHSAIFYFSVLTDAAGVPYEYNRAFTALHENAGAPMFGLFEEEVGIGSLGGPVISLHEQNERTAQVAAQMLKGELPEAMQISVVGPDKLVFDWRELERWGVHEEQLPSGSLVRFHTRSLDRRRILGVLAICGLESLLIFALVHQLRRRKRTEGFLRESEDRMKLAAHAAGLVMWEWNMVTDQIWVTGQVSGSTAVFNARQSEFNHFLKAVPPDEREAVMAAAQRAMQGNGEFGCVHRAYLSDGRCHWMSTRGRAEFDKNHRPLRMRGISMDVTAQKEAEDSARESERRFALLADSAPVLIWASGPDKLCTFFNKPWLDFTGRGLEQERGNGWTEGVHRDDLAECLKIYTQAFEVRRPFAMEYRLRRHDGQYRWVLDHGVPRYDAQQTFLGYIGSCMDVTERREAEAEAHRSRQELAHVNRWSTLGELAGSLAHELNQPLASILSNAQALQRIVDSDSAEPGEVREIVVDIVDQDRRAGQIIARMRSMLQKSEPKLGPQDLNKCIDEVLSLMHSELVLRNVAVDRRLARSLPGVRADRIQLQQVLMNLVLNACEAMSANPVSERRLKVETRITDGDLVQTTLADSGPGFTPAIGKRAFEPLCTTKATGLGLGLAICRSIIHTHGGRIWLDESGPGAIVHFTLPMERTTLS
jgi:PAS domain S-box-containing protein